MAEINFTITEEPTINLSITDEKVINLTVSDKAGGILPYYTGSYSVTPKTTSQTLATENKSMKEDVVVSAITYTEVHNEKGITVTIGEV